MACWAAAAFAASSSEWFLAGNQLRSPNGLVVQLVVKDYFVALTADMDPFAELPFIDAHSLVVKAPPERAWDETAQVMRRWVEQLSPGFGSTAGPLLARLLGCSNVDPSPPGPGAPKAIVGFRVARAERPSLIAFEGQHRLSRYALSFRIEPAGDTSCIVKAETRAAFPGRVGGVYRQAVIGSGGHVLVVRRLLSSIKRRAERS